MLATHKKNNTLKLAIISFTPCQSFSFGCAQELFINNIANLSCWYQSEVIHWEKFQPAQSSQILENTTLVLLDVAPSGISNETALMQLLTEFYHQGKRIVALGSGVSLLARSGLLNGKKWYKHAAVTAVIVIW